jgi:hypothetical protein
MIPTTVPFCPALPANIPYSSSQMRYISDLSCYRAAMDDWPHFKCFHLLQCFGEKNLIMTRGFFTTSFMLPEGLVCRSLEICAYCTCKQTYQLTSSGKWHFV